MSEIREGDRRLGFGVGTQDPETVRIRRLEREEREGKRAIRKREQFRNAAALGLILGGILCTGIGIWFLVLSPA